MYIHIWTTISRYLAWLTTRLTCLFRVSSIYICIFYILRALIKSEENPEGEFPDDLIDDKVNDLVSDVRRDPEEFMETFGLNWEDYIDKDDFIESKIMVQHREDSDEDDVELRDFFVQSNDNDIFNKKSVNNIAGKLSVKRIKLNLNENNKQS